MTIKYFGDNFIVYLVDDTPRTIEDAYSSPEADYWKEAVRSEMDSIMSNRTWEVVERPYGCKSVGCKWMFKKNLGQMVLLKSTRPVLWPKVIPKMKENIFLTLIHQLPD